MKITCLVIACVLYFQSFSQVEISGRVIDDNTKLPIEYAEVVLLNAGSEIATGSITDAEGVFKLIAKKGEYTVLISYVGTDLFKKTVVFTSNTSLGIIEVENALELEQVIVTGQKKLITREIDRLVFNVENSTKSSEGDALEVLKVTPGIRVQNDRITVIGKGSLRVMINDKILRISGNDLVNFLTSIASEDIKNIEVITTPPAKYDAQGNSGLVNINLKKTTSDSWNAQLRSYYRQRKYSLGSLGGSFNYGKNRLSIASAVSYRNGSYYQEQDDYTYFPNGIWHLSSPYKAIYDGISTRIDVNYKISTKWSMGGQYIYNQTKAVYNDQPNTNVFNNTTNEIVRSLQSVGKIKPDSKMHSFNYNAVFLLDTLKRKVSVDFDYFDFANTEESSYEGNQIITETNSAEFYKGFNGNGQSINNISVKLDIDYPTGFAKINFGGKFSTTKSSNAIDFFNSGLVEQPVVTIDLKQNDFKYKEDVQAVYLSLSKKLNSKFSVKLGARMEATKTNSTSNNLNLDFTDDYVKIFPTFYLSYDATENSTFAFNYSVRIQRPSFIELNPNTIFINPFQVIEGNAFLKPAFIDNLELTNSYKSLESKVYYSYEDNVFSQVPLSNAATNLVRFTNQNFIDRNRFGISENFTFDRIKWWSSNNSIDVNYSISTFNLEQEQNIQKGYNATVSTYNDFVLKSDKTFVAGLNFWYEFPGVNGIFNKKAASSLSLSLRYLLLDKNLNITFRANDILKDALDRTEATINGVYQTARYYYDNQYLQLSVSYKLGNKKIRAKRHKTGNREEKNRTR